MTAPDRRQVSLGPGIPRMDIEPLDLPPAEPAKADRCWLCNGSGGLLDKDRQPITCDACNGTGQNGGGL